MRAWLDDRPIFARPVGKAERCWRWCRRNPVLTLGIVGIVALVVVFSGALWKKHQDTLDALERESIALKDVRFAQEEAQDHLTRSLYEQARALRITTQPGSRWRIIELVARAERLRSRKRHTPIPQTSTQKTEGLPSPAALRSEAVSALLMLDARLVRSEGVPNSQPGLSSSARLAAFPSADGIRLLDLGTGRDIGRWSQPEIIGTALAVDNRGQQLACWKPKDRVVAIWNLATGKRTQELAWPTPPNADRQNGVGPEYLVSSELSWSPDGRYLSGIYRGTEQRGRQTLVLWDVTTDPSPRTLVTVQEDTDRGGACFTTDGSRILYPTGEHTVTVWESETGEQVDEVHIPLPVVGKPALDGSGRHLACPCAGVGDAEGVIIVCDFADRRESLRLDVDADLRASVLAFHPSGDRLALGNRTGRLSIFDLFTERRPIDLRAAHPYRIVLLGWTDSGRQLVSWGVLGGLLKSWEVSNPPMKEFRAGQTSRHVALSPDGGLLAVSDAETQRIGIFDRVTGSLHRELLGSKRQAYLSSAPTASNWRRSMHIGPWSGTFRQDGSWRGLSRQADSKG